MESVPREKRLLPHAVDFVADHDPERVFAFLPNTTELEDGFSAFTYKSFAKAIDAAAWWMDNVLGGAVESGDFPTVPYIGGNDIRYALLFYAAIKTRRKLMIPFAANTTEGLVALLEATQSSVVAAPASHRNAWDAALAQRPDVKFIEVPEVVHFLHDRPVPKYTYARNIDHAMEDAVVVFQTSGTTGNPRPIVTGYDFIEDYRDAFERTNHAPPNMKVAFYDLFQSSYTPILLPLSWSAPFTIAFIWPVMSDCVPILLPASIPQPPPPRALKQIFQTVPRGPKNGAFFVPGVLAELAKDLENLEVLMYCDWIGYGGAPLDREIGKIIRQQTHVRLQSFMGSSESGAYPALINDPDDWQIHRFHPDWRGWHLEPFHDDLYEMCIAQRKPSNGVPASKEPPTYHTKDLFRAVPGKEGFWENAGRADDFVKLDSLTKFNAAQIEQILNSNSAVTNSLMAGDGRSRPFAIIEPSANDASERSREKMLEKIWPAVENANEHLYEEARLVPQLILIADSGKPIRRTQKGTVERRNTLLLYEEEIGRMYAGLEPVNRHPS